MQFFVENMLNHIKYVRSHQIYKNKLIFLFSKSGDDIEEKFATKMEFVNEPEVAIKIEPEYEVKIEEPEVLIKVEEPDVVDIKIEEPEFDVKVEEYELEQNVEYNSEENIGDEIFYENNVDLDSKSCEICNKTFSSKINLKNHFEGTHLGLIKYKCDMCEKGYTTVSGLNTHINVVHKKIRFNCSHCDQTFSEKGNLKVHVQRIHLGMKKKNKTEKVKKNTKCEICNREFEFPSRLKEHFKVIHERTRDHACSKCEKTFQRLI